MKDYSYSYRDASLRKQIRSAVAQGLRDTTGLVRVHRPVLFRAARNSVVRPLRVGWEVRVPSGRGWSTVKVTPPRVGCRFGQFAPTKAWFKPVVKKASPVAKPKAKGAAVKK